VQPEPRTMLDLFRSLPEAEQHEILGQIKLAMMWRGWDRGRAAHAVEHVQNIAEVFARNGHEFDEYT
jgi:hypothetical protein